MKHVTYMNESHHTYLSAIAIKRSALFIYTTSNRLLPSGTMRSRQLRLNQAVTQPASIPPQALVVLYSRVSRSFLWKDKATFFGNFVCSAGSYRNCRAEAGTKNATHMYFLILDQERVVSENRFSTLWSQDLVAFVVKKFRSTLTTYTSMNSRMRIFGQNSFLNGQDFTQSRKKLQGGQFRKEYRSGKKNRKSRKSRKNAAFYYNHSRAKKLKSFVNRALLCLQTISFNSVDSIQSVLRGCWFCWEKLQFRKNFDKISGGGN